MASGKSRKSTTKKTAKVETTVPSATNVLERVRGTQQIVAVGKAGGRPMLNWIGKRAPATVQAFPAQWVETYGDEAPGGAVWKDWPDGLRRGGLLYHGDNKEVLAHLLASGFRGQVKLIYIDPPFDSGADYVRKVELRGPKGKAKLEGEGYTLGEQIQYTDIWANDQYLQFMYERLMLLKELLAEDGSIYLHCDHARSHVLRCLLDEVFGADNFLGEIVWAFRERSISKTYWNRKHNTILYYKKGPRHTFNLDDVREEYSEEYLAKFKYEDEDGKYQIRGKNIPGSPVRQADGLNPSHEEKYPGLTYRQYLHDGGQLPVDWWKIPYSDDDEIDGDLWEIPLLNKAAKERAGYPTQKPEALLARIIAASSNAGDIVLDCFIGSGTTAAVAQKLGRRWIGCDINKGAIQTAAKRLQTATTDQIAEGAKPAQGKLLAEGGAPPPAQLGFTHWRVNDYDLAIQHNEAVALACEYLGVERLRTDSFFDGVLGKQLVKIIPFGHPLSPADLEAIRNELDARPEEDRAITVVCLGKELAADKWLEDWNRLRKKKTDPHHIEVIELRSDPKYGGFLQHEPAQARLAMKRSNGKLHVEIKDFVSPGIVARLAQQSGVVQPKIADWRSMVDSVMIDPAYDGVVFSVALADVPERKTEFVQGSYELPTPGGNTTVAVKITDMLGEEVLVTAGIS